MKTVFLSLLIAFATIAYVQGANSCGGKPDKTYCPDSTTTIRVEKKTREDDNNIMDITVVCKNDDTLIATCSDVVNNPYPGVHINSFQLVGTYTNKHKVNHNINRNTNVASNNADDTDVETFD